MGTMLGKLKQLNLGDQRIIVALDNIRQFHRNPIAHPGEQIHSAEECLDLVAALRAAMGYMLEVLPLDFTPTSASGGLFSSLMNPFVAPKEDERSMIQWEGGDTAPNADQPKR
jgi:hypothetical protein